MNNNFETTNRLPKGIKLNEVKSIFQSLKGIGVMLRLSVIIAIIVAIGIEETRAAISNAVKNNDKELFIDNLPNSLDLDDDTFIPDRDEFVNGENNIEMTSKGNNLILTVSDSLFTEESFPFLSVGVEDGQTSDMPILGEVLNESGEIVLNIPLLMADKDFARIVVWINNTGDNDGKRIATIQRNTDGTFSVYPQSSDDLLVVN